MRHLSAVTVLSTLLATFTLTPARAGGLIQTLPKAGSWATYRMAMKNEGPNKSEMTGTLTLRNVGSITEQGEKCCWIELQFKTTEKDKQRTGVMKLLVREKEFAPKAKSLPTVIRGWKNENDQPAKKLNADDRETKGIAVMVFAPPKSAVTPLKKEKVIDFQKGKLKIDAGKTGPIDFNPVVGTVPAEIMFETIQSIWTHQSVPFGAAAMEVVTTVSRKGNTEGKMTMTFTLHDYGTGAKSAIPGKN